MSQVSYIKIYKFPRGSVGQSFLGTINGSRLESIEWGKRTLDATTTTYITGCYSESVADHDFDIQITALDTPGTGMDLAYPTPESKAKLMDNILDEIVKLSRSQNLPTVSNVAEYYPPNNVDLGAMELLWNPFESGESEGPGEEMLEGPGGEIPGGGGEGPPPGEGIPGG